MTLRMNIHMDKTFDNTTLSLRYLKNILPRYFENNKMSIVQWFFLQIHVFVRICRLNPDCFGFNRCSCLNCLDFCSKTGSKSF